MKTNEELLELSVKLRSWLISNHCKSDDSFNLLVNFTISLFLTGRNSNQNKQTVLDHISKVYDVMLKAEEDDENK